jgi:protein AbiQ
MIKLERKLWVLSQDFYNDYTIANFPEILIKINRPYCIALLVIDGIQFAIPLRSNINHRYSYLFRGSPRADKSGLDFTKAVVINDQKYIADNAWIDNTEYSEYINNLIVIANRFENFISEYKAMCANPQLPYAQKLLKFCSLQYFHQELGIK